MNLSKESKVGTIIKKNIKKAVAIPLTFGVVTVCGMMYNGHLEENKNLTYSKEYPSYSQQVEQLFQVDISEENESRINKLEDVSNLISEYQDEKEESRKKNIYGKLMENKKDIENICLRILKEDIAKEKGGKWDDYTIWQEHADGLWLTSGRGDSATLHGKQETLVDAIGNCQIVGYSSDYEEAKNPDKVVQRYDKMILETARFVKNVSEKTK